MKSEIQRLKRAQKQIDCVIRFIQKDAKPLEILAQLAVAIGFEKKVASHFVDLILNAQEDDNVNWDEIAKGLKYISKFALEDFVNKKVLPEKPLYGPSRHDTIINEE